VVCFGGASRDRTDDLIVYEPCCRRCNHQSCQSFGSLSTPFNWNGMERNSTAELRCLPHRSPEFCAMYSNRKRYLGMRSNWVQMSHIEQWWITSNVYAPGKLSNASRTIASIAITSSSVSLANWPSRRFLPSLPLFLRMNISRSSAI
jgi:hypothetical protein